MLMVTTPALSLADLRALLDVEDAAVHAVAAFGQSHGIPAMAALLRQLNGDEIRCLLARFATVYPGLYADALNRM